MGRNWKSDMHKHFVDLGVKVSRYKTKEQEDELIQWKRRVDD